MARHKVLVVDVGNSRVKSGLFAIEGSAVPQVLRTDVVRLQHGVSEAESLQRWFAELEPENPVLSVVAGSNPPARDQLLAQWPSSVKMPKLVCSFADVPISVDVDSPSRVGIDRLLTAFAAHRLFAAGHAAIVVDSGTATTVDLITSDGTFRGGAILPGLRLSAFALHDYTARLPFIDTDTIGTPVTDADAPVPGRNTTEAICSGLFWGQLGAIRELRSRLDGAALRQFGEEHSAVCVLTGGGGRQLADHLTPCLPVDSLALHGLALVAAGLL